ncbi:MAG: hypothetical protein LC127_09250 [Chitinophagales bacterium]|nr:hypothetical protein [Chitinophagales bacterium]
MDRTLNEWSEWQMKNLNAIVWLYRGEKEKYTKLLQDYRTQIINDCRELDAAFESVSILLNGYGEKLKPLRVQISDIVKKSDDINQLLPLNDLLKKYTTELNASLKLFLSTVMDWRRMKLRCLLNPSMNPQQLGIALKSLFLLA